MASRIPESMLRELRLTPEETRLIVEEAERIISETLTANELFLANDRHLSKRQWKLVKTKETVQVYRTRSEKTRAKMTKTKSKRLPCPITEAIMTTLRRQSSTGSSDARPRSDTNESNDRGNGSGCTVTTSSESESSGSGDTCGVACGSGKCDHTVEINKTKPADIPLLIATGIIAGTVEDVAFGNLAYTERLTRYRDAHIQDEYAGVKILATILKPTAQEPFQSLVIKWNTKSVGTLSRMRDCVYIEANGIAITADGERVAYNLVHSIDSIPRIPGFKHLDIVRVNRSTCYLSRQYDQSSVEVFCRGYADPRSAVGDAIATNGFVDMVLSVVHVVDCAYIKKLMWLAHKKRRSMDTVSNKSRSPDPNNPATHCKHCSTSRTKFGSLLHLGTACKACRQEICNKCSVAKKVAVEASATEMKIKSATYCVPCVVEAKNSSAGEAAVMLMKILDPGWKDASE
ncbi:hypothetical protein Gpo141_00005480 [Globisporangium polare]